MLRIALALVCLCSSALSEPYNKATRQQWAQRGLEVLGPIHGALPTLSPSENAWVIKEGKAAIANLDSGGQRLDKLAETREFWIFRARIAVDAAHSALVPIATGRLSEKQNEVWLWAIAINSLRSADITDYLPRLATARLIEAKLLKDGNFDKLFRLKMIADIAMSQIVIPFLNNELPD